MVYGSNVNDELEEGEIVDGEEENVFGNKNPDFFKKADEANDYEIDNTGENGCEFGTEQETEFLDSDTEISERFSSLSHRSGISSLENSDDMEITDKSVRPIQQAVDPILESEYDSENSGKLTLLSQESGIKSGEELNDDMEMSAEESDDHAEISRKSSLPLQQFGIRLASEAGHTAEFSRKSALISQRFGTELMQIQADDLDGGRGGENGGYGELDGDVADDEEEVEGFQDEFVEYQTNSPDEDEDEESIGSGEFLDEIDDCGDESVEDLGEITAVADKPESRGLGKVDNLAPPSADSGNITCEVTSNDVLPATNSLYVSEMDFKDPLVPIDDSWIFESLGEEVKPKISSETSTVGTQADDSIRTETEDVAELQRKFEEEKSILVHNLYSLLVTARYQIGNLKKENKKLEDKLQGNCVLVCPECKHRLTITNNLLRPKYTKVLRGRCALEMVFRNMEAMEEWLAANNLDINTDGLPVVMEPPGEPTLTSTNSTLVRGKVLASSSCGNDRKAVKEKGNSDVGNVSNAISRLKCMPKQQTTQPNDEGCTKDVVGGTAKQSSDEVERSKAESCSKISSDPTKTRMWKGKRPKSNAREQRQQDIGGSMGAKQGDGRGRHLASEKRRYRGRISSANTKPVDEPGQAVALEEQLQRGCSTSTSTKPEDSRKQILALGEEPLRNRVRGMVVNSSSSKERALTVEGQRQSGRGTIVNLMPDDSRKRNLALGGQRQRDRDSIVNFIANDDRGRFIASDHRRRPRVSLSSRGVHLSGRDAGIPPEQYTVSKRRRGRARVDRGNESIGMAHQSSVSGCERTLRRRSTKRRRRRSRLASEGERSPKYPRRRNSVRRF